MKRGRIAKGCTPLATMGADKPAGGMTWEQAMAIRKDPGLVDSDADWFDPFISNPSASRKVLGLDD